MCCTHRFTCVALPITLWPCARPDDGFPLEQVLFNYYVQRWPLLLLSIGGLHRTISLPALRVPERFVSQQIEERKAARLIAIATLTQAQ